MRLIDDQMIKILQTSDVHLGAKFESLGDRGAVHRRQIERVFEKTVDLAISSKADLFLIAGDLFDGDNPPQAIIDFVRRQLERLRDTSVNVVIIPGNHDFLSERSVYKKSFWGDIKNVFVFNDPSAERKEYPGLEVTIHAKVLNTKNSTESAISMASLGNAKYNIMMAHGAFIASEGARSRYFDRWPITPDEIKNSKMDYIAIGDFHGMQDVSQGDVSAWYAGSPESIAFDQKNAGNVLLVEIDSNGARVNPVRVGERKFDQLDLALDNVADSHDLKNEILKDADKNLVRKVVLGGFAKPNIFIDEEMLESELGENFFKLIIIDNSVPQLKDVDCEKYSTDLIVGQFVALAREKVERAESDAEKEIMQKVLQLGLAEFEK